MTHDNYDTLSRGVCMIFGLLVGAGLAVGYLHFTEYYPPVCTFLNTCLSQAPATATPTSDGLTAAQWQQAYMTLASTSYKDDLQRDRDWYTISVCEHTP